MKHVSSVRRASLGVVRAGLAIGVWAALTALVGGFLFSHSSRDVVLAGHDAVVRPSWNGKVEIRTGPVLPDVRVGSEQPIGVSVYLGKTDVSSTDELIQRYAVIASNPDGQIAKVEGAVRGMAVTAALRGGVLAAVPVGFWYLLGRRRRAELGHRLRNPALAGSMALVVAAGVAVWEPWEGEEPSLEAGRRWVPVQEFIGAGVAVPDELEDIEVRGDVTTSESRRLLLSAIDTYERSKDFYRHAAEEAATLDLPDVAEDETVVALVSDRHDNIGMDRVARAIADRAGATAVFDAGDDTSTGQTWEAFSLDSVIEAFDGYDAYGVAGNHDHGDFVSTYLADRGWTMLAGEIVEGPAGITLLGVDDPRASGLGNWRNESGLSFAEVGQRLADAACDADEPVATILVHDANLGREALARGCADLVVGGHLHLRQGPEAVVGADGEVGYTYTTGTTGGAAYAIAIGSKPRRAADISLVTYRDGRPVAIQSVTLQTNGSFVVSELEELDYALPSLDDLPSRREQPDRRR